MVDFSGWDMPLHYGSVINEHHAVRRQCGMFDVSHMTVVDVSGPGARDYLRHVLANDVERLEPGQALYSVMLNDHGGVIDDLIVYRLRDRYRLVVNCATREKDLELFMSLTNTEVPESRFDLPLSVVVPSFLTSELKTAFMMGFLLYIPFLIVDMVVASVLMSMGMMMLPPILISLPFKVLLFVLVDGWHLITRSLVTAFAV